MAAEGLGTRQPTSAQLWSGSRFLSCGYITPWVINEKLFAIVDHVLPTPTLASAQLLRAHGPAAPFTTRPDRGLPCVGHQREQPGQPRPALLRVMHIARACLFLPLSHVSKPNVNITSRGRVRGERIGTRRKVRKLYGSVREDRSLKTGSQLGWAENRWVAYWLTPTHRRRMSLK